MEKYTIKSYMLSAREEYMMLLEKLNRLSELVKPMSKRAENVEFSFNGGLLSTSLQYDVIKKITKLDQLLKKTDKKILASGTYTPFNYAPFVKLETDSFDELYEELMLEDFVQNMASVIKFEAGRKGYLLQSGVNDIIITDCRTSESVRYSYDNIIYGESGQHIADILNLLNIGLPEYSLNEYQKYIIENSKVDALGVRVVDSRVYEPGKTKDNSIVYIKK